MLTRSPSGNQWLFSQTGSFGLIEVVEGNLFAIFPRFHVIDML